MIYMHRTFLNVLFRQTENPGTESEYTHLLHFLPEGCEDFIALSKGGLELLKFVHV